MLNRALPLLAVAATFAICTCGGDGTIASTSTGSGGSSTGTTSATTSQSASSSAVASSSSSSSGTGGAGGSMPIDPCTTALFCEKFDSYQGVSALTDNQKFGPWRASLNDQGAVMNLDATHTTSGKSALHIHIDTGASAGGRLVTEGPQPFFQGNPTHVYGRMMMYIDPNGPSIHWTFFGLSGSADSSSPVAGRRATYLMSSLPKNDVNTYSFVYGLEAQGNDPYHDCYYQSPGSMPTAKWTCISFEMDSLARKLRMTENGAATPTASLDDHGQGCVGNVPGDGPWYGPEVDQLYVGALSFHPMVSPLDVWIDDLVVDNKPVLCPAP